MATRHDYQRIELPSGGFESVLEYVIEHPEAKLPSVSDALLYFCSPEFVREEHPSKKHIVTNTWLMPRTSGSGHWTFKPVHDFDRSILSLAEIVRKRTDDSIPNSASDLCVDLPWQEYANIHAQEFVANEARYKEEIRRAAPAEECQFRSPGLTYISQHVPAEASIIQLTYPDQPPRKDLRECPVLKAVFSDANIEELIHRSRGRLRFDFVPPGITRGGPAMARPITAYFKERFKQEETDRIVITNRPINLNNNYRLLVIPQTESPSVTTPDAMQAGKSATPYAITGDGVVPVRDVLELLRKGYIGEKVLPLVARDLEELARRGK